MWMYISSRDCHSFSYDTWILRNPAPPGPAALAAAIIARGLHAVSCATPPARPGSAGGHGRGHHARATCRILRDPAQAGQPELAPAAIARGLRAVLGAGAAVAGATAPLYALPVGLLYAAAVLTLVEVGLHVARRRTTALGAYAPRGSGGGGRSHMTAWGAGLACPARRGHRQVAVHVSGRHAPWHRGHVRGRHPGRDAVRGARRTADLGDSRGTASDGMRPRGGCAGPRAEG
jgi:hypothetical protein